MAIAYFIPDQAKLLGRSSAGSSIHNNNINNNNNSSASPSQATATPTNATTTTATNANFNNSSNNFRANITIPLNPFAPSHAPHVGCWDLITQVFCYALRFYHESSSNNSGPLIQITVEISGGSNNGNGSPSATTTQREQPTSRAAPPDGKN